MNFIERLIFISKNKEPEQLSRNIIKKNKAEWLKNNDLLINWNYKNHSFKFIVSFFNSVKKIIPVLEKKQTCFIIIDDTSWDNSNFNDSLSSELLKKTEQFLNPVKYSTNNIITLLSGNSSYTGEQSFILGKRHIGGIITDPFKDDKIFKKIRELTDKKKPGKLAVCLAGGGIEGLLYEIGVLRAVESYMVNYKIVDFNIFCGISAGAIISSFLANGVGPEELAIGLRDGAYGIDKISRLDIFKPNLVELIYRIFAVIRSSDDVILKESLYNWMIKIVPNGILSGDRLLEFMEKNLTVSGKTNSFKQLTKELYIGATDQDTAVPVVFGESPLDDLPISLAVRASSAMVPFYPPIKIKDRFYIDGAFTRTTNFNLAINHGATLIIIVNPLVPVISEEPGYIASQGGIYSSMQGIKSLIKTRFEQTLEIIKEKNSGAELLVFQPNGVEMKLMAGSLMSYFYREEIQDIGYKTALREIRNNYDSFKQAFERHGIIFNSPEDKVNISKSA